MFIKDFNTAFGTWRTQYWPKDHIFPRNAISFQKCLLFCFTGWKKEKRSIFYIQWFWFLQCNLHYIVVGIAIYVHNNIYIYIFTCNNFILLLQFGWFSKQYKFDIEQMWVQFPAANSAFSEKCFASFHAVQGCFSKKVICQDWTCNYSKDKLTHLNLNLLHASFIFCLQSVAL